MKEELVRTAVTALWVVFVTTVGYGTVKALDAITAPKTPKTEK